jgi:predicted HNH restriction endonuclease
MNETEHIINEADTASEDIGYSDPPYIPNAESFANFLRTANISSWARDVLLAHYAAPDQTAETTEIANALGTKRIVVQGIYGRLGKRAVNFLGIELPSEAIPSHVFSFFRWSDERGRWLLFMHDAVVKAIELLGWDKEARQRFGNFYSEHLDQEASGQAYLEGRLKEARLIARSRNGLARQACIDCHGTSCTVCGFDFGIVYGDHGAGFIEVHHLVQVSSHDEEHEIDPVKDLCPVCANCHRMLHRSDEPLSIEELKSIIARSGKAVDGE